MRALLEYFDITLGITLSLRLQVSTHSRPATKCDEKVNSSRTTKIVSHRTLSFDPGPRSLDGAGSPRLQLRPPPSRTRSLSTGGGDYLILPNDGQLAVDSSSGATLWSGPAA
jgi:hypothetical protein